MHLSTWEAWNTGGTGVSYWSVVHLTRQRKGANVGPASQLSPSR